MKEIKLLGEFDAKIWAKEFMRIFGNKKEKIDEELMIGWFANSIMTGYDKAKTEKKPLPILKKDLK